MRKAMRLASVLVIGLLGGFSMPTCAVDGVVLIDQNRAMTGNVTPGDAPGFPVNITQPGSYRLAGNLSVPDASTDAVVITANNVNLDLNGFSILGPTVCTRPGGGAAGALACSPTGAGNGVKGIQVGNITIMNGTIRGMGGSAILLEGPLSVAPNRVDKMEVNNNGSTGIIVDNGLVANSIAALNGVHGIGMTFGSVSGNYSTNNNAAGLFMSSGGYGNNVFMANGFNSNGSSVLGGGVSLGHNLCGGAVC